MSKNKNFPNDILVDGYTLSQDKDCDGSKHGVELIIDPDYNKEAFEALESRNRCYMLKYDDSWNSYYWNCCAGSYFCGEEIL